MANTYSQIYLHFIFAVQNRLSLIGESWEEDLYRYITGIVENNGHKMLAINGTANHIHVFIGYNSSQAIPDLMKDVKRSSSLWINKKKYVRGQFNWQEGYGVFSYSHSHIDNVAKYVLGRKAHHKEYSFRDEYEKFLNLYNVKYDPKYIMTDIQR